MAYLSNIEGTTSSSFQIGDVVFVHDGDLVKIVYPDSTEFVLSDSTPTPGVVPGDPLAVEGIFDDAPLGYADGEVFAISQSPSGQFAGHAGEVAIYNSPTFEFVEPADGWLVYDKAQGVPIVYAPGVGWTNWSFSPAEIRQAVEDADDSNVFTDDEKAKLAAVEDGATADLSAAEVFAMVLGLDGSGSGLDSDLLDGQDGSYYRNLTNATGTLPGARFNDVSHGSRGGGSLHPDATTSVSGFMSAADKTKLNGVQAGATDDLTGSEILALVGLATDSADGFMSADDKDKLDGIEDGATGDLSGSEILALLLPLDGTGSGLDADRLDGFHAATFATAANPTFTGTATFANIVIDGSIATIAQQLELADPYVVLNSEHSGTPDDDAGIRVERGALADAFITWDETIDAWTVGVSGQMGKVWTDINDGVGSGLDADLLDGQHGSYFQALTNATGTLPGARFNDSSHGDRGGGSLHAAATSSVNGFMSAADKSKLDGVEAAANAYVLPSSVVHRNATATVSAAWTWATGTRALFGNSSQGRVSFESSAFVIAADSSGVPINLRARDSGNVDRLVATLTGDAVTLYSGGSAKLATSSAGATITGNLVIGGLVDGYDVSDMGEKLATIEVGATGDLSDAEVLALLLGVDGSGSGLDADLLDGQHASHFAPIASPSFTGAPTAPTATLGDNSTKIATTAFVASSSANVLVNDSVTNAILADMAQATVKGRAAGGGAGDPQDLTAAQVRTIINVQDGATDDLTALEIRALLLTVDGSASGLDADLLDGLNSTAFGRLVSDQTWTGQNSFSHDPDDPALVFLNTSSDHAAVAMWRDDQTWAIVPSPDGTDPGGLDLAFSFADSAWTFGTTPLVGADPVWHSGNDGSGSGLDADLLDGLHAASFALLAGATFSGAITVGASNDLVTVGPGTIEVARTGGGRIDLKNLGSEDFDLRISYTGSSLTVDSGSGSRTVWDSGNDGASSGLDADTVDGIQAAAFALAATTVTATGGLTGSGTLGADLTLQVATAGITNAMLANVATLTVKGRVASGTGVPTDLTAANLITILTASDGAGSLLDADLLDGQEGAYYLALANATGTLPAARFDDTSHGSRAGGSLHSVATTSIAGFMSAADKTKLDGVEAGATADLTAAEILALLITVDGASSGLDADLLDGHSSAFFAPVASPTFTGVVSSAGQSVVLNSGEAGTGVTAGSVDVAFDRGLADDFHLKYVESGTRLEAGVGATLFPLALRQSAGWGATSIAAWDTADSKLKPAANLSWNGSTLAITGSVTVTGTVDGRDVSVDGTKLDGIESGATGDLTGSEILSLLAPLDGAGSGLDADTLDGQHAAYFAVLLSPAFTGTPTAPTPPSGNDSTRIATTEWVLDEIDDAISGGALADVPESRIIGRAVGAGTGAAQNLTPAEVRTVINVENGATADQTGAEILAALLSVDGSGSGLDADLLDGLSSAAYAQLAGATFSASVSSAAFTTASAILKSENTHVGSWSSFELRSTHDDGTLGRAWMAVTKGASASTGDLAFYVRSGGGSFAKALAIDYGGNGTLLGKLLVASGDATTPGFAFSADTDTGLFYAATRIAASVGGTERFAIDATALYANNAAGPSLLNVAATGTVPSLLPNRADPNTGIGWPGADQLTLVVGGSAGLTVTASGTTIAGNLTVSGTTTTVNSETLTVDDNVIVLNNNVTGSPTEDGGVEIERGTSTNAVIYWDEAADKWKCGLAGAGQVIFTADTDGAGSGLDADTLDGYDSAAFPRKAENATIAGQWTFSDELLGPNGSAATPAYSFSSDPDSGLYRSASDIVSIAVGGAEALRAAAAATSVPAGTDSAPGLSFIGDENTGLYGAAADQIGVALAGTAHWLFSTTSLAGATSGAAAVKDVAASGTVPTLVPHRGDLTTGIGAQASGNLSVVVQGVERARATTSGFDVTGALTATTKSFDIPHPTKDGQRLRYGSLEGPEHGVYFRGVVEGPASGTEVVLPEHWAGLVRAGSLTATATAEGRGCVHVAGLNKWRLWVRGSWIDRLLRRRIKFHYLVMAEREDVPDLRVEYDVES